MTNISMKYKTRSAAETKKVARLFAEEVMAMPSRRRAFVVLFKGDLGAGKTTFIQSLLRELGVKKKVVSPTFALLRSYKLPVSILSPRSLSLSFPRRRESSSFAFTTAHHFDCYRIGEAKEMQELGFGELVKDPRNIILIEWPDRIKELLPREKVTVVLSYGETINERTIEIR